MKPISNSFYASSILKNLLSLNKIVVGMLMSMIFWSAQSCIEPFDGSVASGTKILVCENVISDIAGDNYVILKRSITQGISAYDEFIDKAKVELVINSKESILLQERPSDKGYYYLPNSFKAAKGTNYQLKFELPNGQKYESAVEELANKAPEINKVYQEFNSKAIAISATKTSPGHTIYIDFNDNGAETNYYQFKWTLWEKQDICLTCPVGTRYYAGKGCVKDGTFFNVFYDYNCDTFCWEVFNSRSISTSDDILSNGKLIIRQQAAKIPFYQYSQGLVRVEIASITRNYHRYLNIIAAQSQTNGGLADTPPSPIIGNIRNVQNPQESIVGYFGVVSLSTKTYKIARNDTGGSPPLLLLGRDPILEPYDPFAVPARPPLVSCDLSRTRTPIQPIGW